MARDPKQRRDHANLYARHAKARAGRAVTVKWPGDVIRPRPGDLVSQKQGQADRMPSDPSSRKGARPFDHAQGGPQRKANLHYRGTEDLRVRQGIPIADAKPSETV
jgi:hypothetical protein